MMHDPKTTDWESIFQLFLRVWGCLSATALVFVFVPFGDMNAIHQWLGMGPLPDSRVLGYLARSTSAFYGFMGGLFWVLSFDIKRHHLVIGYVGSALICFGFLLLVIDWREGMPMFWKVWEGPFMSILGVATLFLNRKVYKMQADPIGQA